MTTETAAPADVDELSVGIAPVPAALRRLRTVDIGVLWGDLAVGVLVLAAGALLVAPEGLGVDLGPALGAIAVGSIVGTVLLALVGLAAHDLGVPTMVMLRPVLGRLGSYGASVVNVVQLVGWTAFELWAMALFASHVSDELFGFRAYGLWLAAAAVVCTALALAGPARVVRRWLERFGVWLVLVTCGYLTIYLIVTTDLGDLFASRGGGVGFARAVDWVVAMPVSWLPLVADYNRFSAGRRQNFLGTFGYAIGNFWFFALGALLVLSAGVVDSSPEGIAAGILGLSSATLVGVALLLALLTGETDEAFADIYSASVSVQNVVPRVSQRPLVLAVSVLGTAIAAVVTASDFELFLFLLGSVFVPLFAVVLAWWAAGGLSSSRAVEGAPSLRPAMLAAWLVGFGVYQWAVPTGPDWWVEWVTDVVPGAGEHGGLGASLPAFAVAFGLAWLLARLTTRPAATRSIR